MCVGYVPIGESVLLSPIRETNIFSSTQELHFFTKYHLNNSNWSLLLIAELDCTMAETQMKKSTSCSMAVGPQNKTRGLFFVERLPHLTM